MRTQPTRASGARAHEKEEPKARLAVKIDRSILYLRPGPEIAGSSLKT